MQLYECILWSNREKSKVVPLSLFIILSRNFIFCDCTVNKGGSYHHLNTFLYIDLWLLLSHLF